MGRILFGSTCPRKRQSSIYSDRFFNEFNEFIASSFILQIKNYHLYDFREFMFLSKTIDTKFLMTLCRLQIYLWWIRIINEGTLSACINLLPQSKQCRQAYKYSRSNNHYSGGASRGCKIHLAQCQFSAAEHKPFIIGIILPFALAPAIYEG